MQFFPPVPYHLFNPERDRHMPYKFHLTDKETVAQRGAQLKTKLDLESWAPEQSEESDVLTR